MIAAALPIQRPAGAKLLVADAAGHIHHRARAEFATLLRAGDLVIANDAATLPASLHGRHIPSARPIEVRLAGRRSFSPGAVTDFSAIVFGPGDFHTRTEDRAAPPPLHPGDRLALGPLDATITRLENHSRLVSLHFKGAPRSIWEGLARHGRPIQYAHVPTPLALWDTWTPIAGPPVAFEPPSAGFMLDWRQLAAFAQRGVRFATITHAAGISSTGDPQLDALLPFDEPYRIPESTARLIQHASRVVAIGTTVVRALEHSAGLDGAVRAGEGLANQRIGPSTKLHVVDAILSGTHEPGSSHYQLLRAFTGGDTLRRIDDELAAHQYLTHEFGDSVFVEAAEFSRRSLLGGRRIDHGSDLRDPVCRKSRFLCVLPNGFRVRRKIHAVDTVVRNIAMNPLDPRSHFSQSTA